MQDSERKTSWKMFIESVEQCYVSRLQFIVVKREELATPVRLKAGKLQMIYQTELEQVHFILSL